MILHTGFGLGWLSKEGYDNTGASPVHSDLVPAVFYQYPWQKSVLKGWHICDATNIIKHVMEELKRLSQNGFQECFRDLDSHCRSVELNKGTVLKEMLWLYGFVFLRNEVMLGTFWSYRAHLINHAVHRHWHDEHTSTYQINTDECTHVLLIHHFITTMCNCSMFEPLKGHLQRILLIRSSS